jgi:hypothetical protein
MPEGQVIKLVNATSLDNGLTSIADAIRIKGGTSADLAFPAGFVSAVEAIPTGGGENFKLLINDATGTAAQWNIPSMQNSLSANGVIEIKITDSNPATDYGNIISLGSEAQLSSYNNNSVIHFYHIYSDNGTIDKIKSYCNGTAYDQEIDSSSQVTIKIENGYIYVNGIQIGPLPSSIQNLTSISIGSKEGHKRFQGTYNKISYK